ESAQKHLSSDDQASLSRYSISGYVDIRVMAVAIKRCDQRLTRGCVTDQLGKVKVLATGGRSGPILLDNPQGRASHPLLILQVNAKDGSLRAVTDFMPYTSR